MNDSSNNEIEEVEYNPEKVSQLDGLLKGRESLIDEQKDEKEFRVFKEIKEYVMVIIIALFVATIVNTSIFSISNVKETSMMPTLEETDVMVLNRLAYLLGEPKRDDIIVMIEDNNANMTFFGRVERMYRDLWNKLNKIETRDRLVKRVVGIEGDQLQIVENKLYINGQVESSKELDLETMGRAFLSDEMIIVPEGQVFVLGDNRSVSRDSRSFGFVDVDNLEGKVSFRILPINKFGKVD